MDEFDTLTLYHHKTYDFDAKLQHLLSILKLPKEFNLTARFTTIEHLLDKTFRLELLHRLQLISPTKPSSNDTADDHHTPPHILLHLWCLLGCTDSINDIADYLELTIEEVYELIRELHHTFSIDTLVSQIQQYYEKNKQAKEVLELQKKNEFLDHEYALEPKDTTENRKKRLKRKYGHLAKYFDLIS